MVRLMRHALLLQHVFTRWRHHLPDTLGRWKRREGFCYSAATSLVPRISELCQLYLVVGTCVCRISHSFLLAVRRYYDCWWCNAAPYFQRGDEPFLTVSFSKSTLRFWSSKALALGTSGLYFWRLWKRRTGEARSLSTWSRACSVER